MLPVLLEHGRKIGVVLFLKQDDIGVYAIVKVDGNYDNLFFSCGFNIIKYSIINNTRYLEEIKLKEVSIVQNPSQQGTYYE